MQLKDFCNRNFLKETKVMTKQIRPRYKNLLAILIYQNGNFTIKSLSAVISLNI